MCIRDRSLSYLLNLSTNQLNTIGRENRKRAIQLFSEKFVIDQYIALFDWIEQWYYFEWSVVCCLFDN